MSGRQVYRSAQALFNVFVAPFAAQLPAKSIPSTIFLTRPQSITCIQRASSTKAAKKPVRQVQRKEKWNDEITARKIVFVDPATGKLQAPVYTRDVLRDLDHDVDRLIQLVPDRPGDPYFTPICKIVNKKEEYDLQRQRERATKEAEKRRAAEVSVKTVEVNWAIDHHDLDMRMARMQQFLTEGRKVEVILAGRKRGRRATEDEAKVVIKKITSAVDAVPGARESKAMQGKVGHVAMMFFQGKARTGTTSEMLQKAEMDGSQQRAEADEVQQNAVVDKTQRQTNARSDQQ